MKKIYAILLILSFIKNPSLFAQERKFCFTDEVYRETMLKHPEFLQQTQALEEFTQNFIRNNQPERRGASIIYVIPVVFHIIHNYGPENISDAQVLDAVRILNRDYNLQNADTADVIPDFTSLIANIGVEFRLATIDPNGNCTNGIDRIVSFLTDIGNDTAKFNPWTANKYLNIWTVNKFGGAHTGAAAYAYLPGTAPTTLRGSADGVISLASYVGSIGTSNENKSRTLTHEVGHYFNLRHPWGNTNQPGVACGDDLVGDTPITKGWTVCPSANYDVCVAGTNENFQNYMDYSYCDVMFTVGQKSRMLASINSTVGGRSNLWSPGNLIATGTDGSTVQICAPKADFFPYRDHICTGDSVLVLANCFNTDTLTSYLWSFPSGSPSSSTLQNPSVTYSLPGQYNVTLTATNPYGSGTKTRNGVISVSDTPMFTPPYINGFESAGDFPGPGGWIQNDSGVTWQRITTVGYSGTSCLKMANYNTHQAEYVDTWVTPSIDFSGYGSTNFTFRMAYAHRSDMAGLTDKLTVSVSIDCGKTWTIRKTLTGTGLSTATVVGSFTPTSLSQWSLVTVSLLSVFTGKPDTRFRFEFTSDGDNNLYIDDINISASPTGIAEAGISPFHFEIFPNPSNDIFNISFDIQKSEKTEVEITDILGREIKTVVNDFLPAGVHEYAINTQQFSKGIYLVTLKTGTSTTVKKLIVQ